MPELPEVEAVTRRLQEAAGGATIVAARFFRPQTTHPVDGETVAARLAGTRLQRAWRRGKNVLLGLSSGETLRVHLRMTGNLFVLPAEAELPGATRALFTLADGRRIVFEDPRLLGRMALLSQQDLAALDAALGPEPLDRTFTAAWLGRRLTGLRRAVKLVLLDQSVVVGLGNIWVAEALFHAGVAPIRPARDVSGEEILGLHRAIRRVLSRAVKSAYRAYSAPGHTPESEGFGVAVYGREGEPCAQCGATIRRIGQGGRSSYFCPRCQRCTLLWRLLHLLQRQTRPRASGRNSPSAS